MMLPSVRDLFLQLYQDLDVLTHDRALDPHDTVRCGAILRQLLTEGRPLVHQANRATHLKLGFVINLHMDIDEFPSTADIVFQGLGLSPLLSDSGHGQESVNLERFLATTVLQEHGETFTVRDLIDFLANKAGGVHLDPDRSEREERFEETLQVFYDSGYESVARTIQGIGIITLQGLRELRDQLAAA